MLLDVAARFASEHGVPEGEDSPRTESGRCDVRPGSGRCSPTSSPVRPAEDEVFELLRDAVDARDRFPRLWSAATEAGVVGGRALAAAGAAAPRQVADRDAPDRRDQVVVLRSEPDLWHAVFRASRFLGRLHTHGLTDDQILALIDTHVQDSAVDLRAG